MSAKLIYHSSDSESGGVSPFDEAICRITKDEEVCMACPYLGLGYIRRLIENSKSWLIITDVEEWIISQAVKARRDIRRFISENLERIHHCRNLHAKVIIAGNNALVGSANFTDNGITRRIEVSVLFQQTEQVGELQAWFTSLWESTDQIDLAELDNFMSSLPQEPTGYPDKTCFRISSKGPRIRAKLHGTNTSDGNATAKLQEINTWEIAVLKCIESLGGLASTTHINQGIGKFRKLTQNDLREDNNFNREHAYYHTIRSTTSLLCKGENLERVKPGLFQITRKGEERIRDWDSYFLSLPPI